MLPLGLFASRTFSAANSMTLLVYAALGAVLFFLVIDVQTVLGYGALEAGMATLPITILMLLLASRGGALGTRIGPRIPMTVGPLVMAVGVAWLSFVDEGTSYWLGVLPPLCVFALGLALMVAPLTATVLGAAPADRAGVASGVNNAVARAGSLFAVAALPVVVGLSGAEYDDAQAFSSAYSQAMLVCAGLLVAGESCRGSRSRTSCRPSLPSIRRVGCRRRSWTARTAVDEGPRTTLSTMTRGRLGLASAATTVVALLLASCGTSSSDPVAGSSPGPVASTSSTTPTGPADPSSPPLDPAHAVADPGPFRAPLHTADMMIFRQRPLSAAMVRRIRHVDGVTRVERFSLAQVSIDDHAINVAAINPATYRNYNPYQVAKFQQEWNRIAGGEMAIRPQFRKQVPKAASCGWAPAPTRRGSMSASTRPRSRRWTRSSTADG